MTYNIISTGSKGNAVDTIYLGVFSQISVSDFVKDFFKDERNNPNVTDAKVCYASLKLDNLGVYIQNTFGFSTMPWALRQLEAGKANTKSWSEDFDKLRKNLLERLGENRKELAEDYSSYLSEIQTIFHTFLHIALFTFI